MNRGDWILAFCVLFAISLISIDGENNSHNISTERCGERHVHVDGKPEGRIGGGSRAPFGAYPWQAALLLRTDKPVRVKCGGTLLNDWWIVTAAHCFQSIDIRTQMTDLVIRLGEWNLRERDQQNPPEDFGVTKIQIHPDYAGPTFANIGGSFDSGKFRNDLALLKLSRQVERKPHIFPICLPSQYQSFVGQVGTVSGWGISNDSGHKPDYLHEVQVEIFSTIDCQEQFHRVGELDIIYDGPFLCAGHLSGSRHTCRGDSGGPLTVQMNGRHTLVGIVSWGPSLCGLRRHPDVYTNVTKYVDWINGIIT